MRWDKRYWSYWQGGFSGEKGGDRGQEKNPEKRNTRNDETLRGCVLWRDRKKAE